MITDRSHRVRAGVVGALILLACIAATVHLQRENALTVRHDLEPAPRPCPTSVQVHGRDTVSDPCGLRVPIRLEGLAARHTDRRFFPERKITVQDRMVSLRNIMMFIATVLPHVGVGYWLDGGSLLGAIRNGRSMPWDPDADIAMTVENYARLQSACRCSSTVQPDSSSVQPEAAHRLKYGLCTKPERLLKWKSQAKHTVRQMCPGLSSLNYVVELDVTPYRVPGRITDTQTGFYADIFVFHGASQYWESPGFFRVAKSVRGRVPDAVGTEDVVGHVPDTVRMPRTSHL